MGQCPYFEAWLGQQHCDTADFSLPPQLGFVGIGVEIYEDKQPIISLLSFRTFCSCMSNDVIGGRAATRSRVYLNYLPVLDLLL